MEGLIWSDVVLTSQPMIVDLHVLLLCDSLEVPRQRDQKPVRGQRSGRRGGPPGTVNFLQSSCRWSSRWGALQRPLRLGLLRPAGKALPRGPALQPVLGEPGSLSSPGVQARCGRSACPRRCPTQNPAHLQGAAAVVHQRDTGVHLQAPTCRGAGSERPSATGSTVYRSGSPVSMLIHPLTCPPSPSLQRRRTPVLGP